MVHVLAILHAVVLLGGAALGVRRLAGSWGHKLAAAFLLIWGNLVVTALGLGFLGQLNHRRWYFAVSCSLAVVGAALSIWPRLWARRATDTMPEPAADAPLRPTPLVIFAVGAVLLAFAASFTISALVYPNNTDTVAYRLPRPFLYFSQGHLGHPIQAGDFRVCYYPLNGALGYLFLAAYGLDGRFFNFPSLLCWLMAGLGVVLLARDIGASRKGALLAATVYLLSPVVLVCSMSGNDEVIAAAPLLLGILFLHRWWYTQAHADALLGALGLGLSMGTKLHWMFFFAYVPLVLGALVWHLVRAGQARSFFRQRAGQLVMIGLIAVGLSCPFLIINYLATGHPINQPDTIAAVANKPFRPRAALINTEILTAQMFLSPFPDLLISKDRAQVTDWYQRFNEFWNWGFTWFDTSDQYAPPWYRFRGVALLNDCERYTEYSLWIGFTPYLLLLAVGCLFWVRGSRTARVAAWLVLGFFCWHFFYAATNRYVDCAGVYYGYPLTLAAAGLAVLWDVGATRRLIRGAFVAVLAAHLLVAVNVYGFSLYRSLTDIVCNHFAAKSPPVEASVTEVMRSAKEIEIVCTEWELQVFNLMTCSPGSRFHYVGAFDPQRPGALRLYSLPTNTSWGFVHLHYPGSSGSRLTLLGTMSTFYGPERIYAVGAGLHERRNKDNDFIALKVTPTRVREGRWCDAVRFDALVYGLAEGEKIELRVEQVLAKEGRHLVADWQLPANLAEEPWPLVPGEGERLLRISARSPVDHHCVSVAIVPLVNEYYPELMPTPKLPFYSPEWVSLEALDVANSEGFRILEGPYPPAFNHPVRWMNAPRARVRFEADSATAKNMALHFRAIRTTDTLIVRLNGQEVFRDSGPVVWNMRDYCTPPVTLRPGKNVLEFEAEGGGTPEGSQVLRVLFEAMDFEPVAQPMAERPARPRPARVHSG